MAHGRHGLAESEEGIAALPAALMALSHDLVSFSIGIASKIYLKAIVTRVVSKKSAFDCVLGYVGPRRL
jgi:hypothetical protein